MAFCRAGGVLLWPCGVKGKSKTGPGKVIGIAADVRDFRSSSRRSGCWRRHLLLP